MNSATPALSSNGTVSTVALRTIRKRVTTVAAVVTAVGFAALVVAYASNERQALASYLFAFGCVFTLVVSALMLVMITELSGAHWFVTIRPLALRIAGALPVLALLSLPILANVRAIYAWATPQLLAPDVRILVERKQAWLSVPFFIVRAALYLLVWIAASELLRRVRPGQLARFSAVSIIAVAVTFTFAAFDWVMSLDPGWFSTIYGVYLFASGILAALALVTVCREVLVRSGAVDVGAKHNEQTVALATLLFTFSIFWVYIAFSQYLIIWIADVPAEVTWYTLRTTAEWRFVAPILLVGQFAIPFALLLPYAPKRKSGVVSGVAACILLMHLLEMYWLVMPAFHEAHMLLHYADLAALMFVGGVTGFTAIARSIPAHSGIVLSRAVVVAGET